MSNNPKILLFAGQYEGNIKHIKKWCKRLKALELINQEDMYIIANNSKPKFVKYLKRLLKGAMIEDVGEIVDTGVIQFKGEKPKGITAHNVFYLMSLLGNMAIDKAIELDYDYLFIMGGDDIVPKDSLKLQLDIFKRDPKMGLVGGLILAKHTEKDFDGITGYATAIEFPSEEYSEWFYREEIPGIPNYNRSLYITIPNWAVGSSGLLIKREVFEKIRFDPDKYCFVNLYEAIARDDGVPEMKMKHKGEDYDYCYRVQDAGYKLAIVPQVVVRNIE